MLSVLLQELALAKDHGRSTVILHESRLTENPVDRLSRFIRTSFWDGLTRRIDSAGLEVICNDPKNRTANQAPRIYVPEREPEMIAYYQHMALAKPHLRLQVDVLPAKFDAAYVKSLNDKPGLLALAMNKVKRADGTTDLKGIPFVVRA
jgi:alpha,alpha-trehalase